MIAMLALLTAFAACHGADPAITNVTTTQTSNGGLTTYTLRVTVTNVGSSGQRSNVLQSVEIRLDRAKNGEKGVPPLARWREVHVPVRRAARHRRRRRNDNRRSPLGHAPTFWSRSAGLFGGKRFAARKTLIDIGNQRIAADFQTECACRQRRVVEDKKAPCRVPVRRVRRGCEIEK